MPSLLKYFVFLLPALLILSGTVGADDVAPAQLVERAMREAGGIPAQATALVALAWPPGGPGDHAVQSLARRQLVHFGHHALAALRTAIRQVDLPYKADATAALIEARRRRRHGIPPNYLTGLEDAIWFGSLEARRLGMIEVSRYFYPPAVLPMIDAIYAHPELTETGLKALSRMRDGRTRFFLRGVLTNADPRFKKLAASALGDVGEAGLAILRALSKSDDRAVREAAMVALLPHTKLDDLTLLYEYVTSNSEDDALVIDAVRDRAQGFETFLEQMEFPDEMAPDAEED
jgi:hypothetical protein